jgi:hypothetical protein
VGAPAAAYWPATAPPGSAASFTWSLSRDEAGDDQIAGKTVDRPTDVNVRDRTFFHSENCAVWTSTG